ncbi:MAG: metallophosphoesterase [Myxococcota bacterium]|nr:metallophosphoesterase [Myxococcota bacterium]
MKPMAAAVALLLLLLLPAAAAAEPPRIEAVETSGATPWTSLEPLEHAQDFRFLVVSDRTGEHRPGVFRDAMPKADLLRPAFVLSVGDLIEGYTEDEAVLDAEWDEIESFVGRLGMPFFYLPGNHDMSNRVMADKWRERFGRSYYHFVYKDVLFLALNSELFGMVHDPKTPVPGPDVQAEQMAYAEEVLAEHAGVRWTFVLVHQPLWDVGHSGTRKPHPDWLRIESLLGDRPFTVFAGHFHKYTKHVRQDQSFITLATTGGGSPLRGVVHGEFDHVLLVTMRPDGPVLANLLLDGIHGGEVRSEAMRRFLGRLEGAVAIRASLGEGDRFAEGSVRFDLANPTSAPLDVVLETRGGRDLVAAPHRRRITLAPGAERTVQVALRTREGLVRYERLAPGSARFALEARGPGGRPVRLAREFALVPERRFALPPLGAEVALDGRLDEWGELAFVVEEPAGLVHPELHRGPEDLSFRFDARVAEGRLLLAVDVSDDSLVVSPERKERDQDRIQVSLDARPEAERSRNEATWVALTNGSMARTIRVNAGPVTPRRDDVMTLFLPTSPDGVEVRSVRTSAGYSAELAIPFDVLDELAGGAWDGFRLQLGVLDFDEGQEGHSDVGWRPDRYGDAAIPGSGTFLRR